MLFKVSHSCKMKHQQLFCNLKSLLPKNALTQFLVLEFCRPLLFCQLPVSAVLARFQNLNKSQSSSPPGLCSLVFAILLVRRNSTDLYSSVDPLPERLQPTEYITILFPQDFPFSIVLAPLPTGS